MKLIKLPYLIFFLILIGCDKKEELSQTEIQIISTISKTSEVGDTIMFEFYVHTNSGLNTIEFYVEDSLLMTKSKDFISTESDSIKFNYNVLYENIGQILDFKILVKDKNGKSNSKNISVNISDDISAEFLTLKVEETYSSASSYRDTGIVHTKFITEDETRLVEKPFKTAFLRSGLYLFQYYDASKENSKYIIHRDKNNVVRIFDESTGDIEIIGSLLQAVARLTGVSSASSINIPMLIMPNELGLNNIFNQIENKEISGSEVIDDIDCYKLTGYYKFNGSGCTIWIQKNNLLIRRISSSSEYDTFKSEDVVDIIGEINIEMEDSEFEFSIPE